MTHLTHGCFNVFPRPVESRYDLAFNELKARSRKRSLVVLMTNILDGRNAAGIESQLTNLVGRHLPLAVLLRDHAIYRPVREYAAQTGDPESADVPDSLLYRAGAAAEVLNWRRLVLKRLGAEGSLTLDVFPEQLTAPLINKYLEIKARHLL